MNGSDRAGGRRGRKAGLSDEDRALWDRFSEAIKPANVKGRVGGSEAERALNGDSRETSADAAVRKGPMPKSASRRPPQPLAKAPVTAKPVPAPPRQEAQFDRRELKRISKGRSGIDARIDLHGMRQAEAHAALRAFLYRAAHKGHRTVLVITGKGSESGRETGAPWDVVSHNTGRGVLRRNVPLWLGEAEFRAIVVSFTSAHVRHGGDGAFYVILRRLGR